MAGGPLLVAADYGPPASPARHGFAADAGRRMLAAGYWSRWAAVNTTDRLTRPDIGR
ncbi:MAG: hypothetical protein K2X74_09800 [Acetobacteraceae bacterium]|nr:hypothetical protein [Acetobacteraceae bacterium]